MSCSLWREVELNQITTKITKGTTPKKFTDFGVNYYKSQCIITSKYLDKTNKVYIDEETHEKLTRSKLEKDDILFSMAGMFLGKTCIVTEEDLPANINQAVALIRLNHKMAHVDYIYYYLNQRNIIYMINNMTSQSAQPNINLKQIGEIKIKLPDIAEQRKIVDILSSIDGKIELNNEMNKTLEEMAQALFKRWFVDFEFPNEDGEPYKSSGGEMVESEFGMIPNGWEWKTLDYVAKLSAGGDKPKITSEVLTEECSIAIYSNGISNEGLYGYTNEAKVYEESVTVSARGTIGFICLRQEPFVPIVRLITLVPKTEFISAKYLYFAIKQMNIMGTGTTQQQLTVPVFKKYSVVLPKFDIIQKFTSIAKPIFNEIKANKEQSNFLRELRDSLIPKLISGEISVEDIEANL